MWYCLLFILKIGDGTASLGDPSWRANSKDALCPSLIEHNAKKIDKQVNELIEKMSLQASKTVSSSFSLGNTNTVFNSLWLSKYSMLNFLRNFGDNFQTRFLMSHDWYPIILTAQYEVEIRIQQWLII